MASEKTTNELLKEIYKQEIYLQPKVIIVPSPTHLIILGCLLVYENQLMRQGRHFHKPPEININQSRNNYYSIPSRNNVQRRPYYSILSNFFSIENIIKENIDIYKKVVKEHFTYNFNITDYEICSKIMMDILQNAIYISTHGEFILPFTSCVLVSKPPIFTKIVNKKFHCTTDYAVYFEDKTGFYFVNGISFTKNDFDKFFISKDFTSEELLLWRNTEQKSIIIKTIGYTEFMKGIKKYTTIDKVTSKSILDGKQIDYEVVELNIPISRWGQSHKMLARFVKVTDFSTDKIVFLGVPVTKQTETCKGAVAWTFGMNSNDYNPDIET